MATIKKSVSLDAEAWALAQAAAEASKMSPSAWLSRAARRQAIRDGFRGGPANADDIAEALAVADEAEAAASGDAGEWRAAG